MPEKFFKVPFANAGTKTTIPDASQPDGTVSYTDGFGPDYALDQTSDPDAKDVPRGGFNEIMYQATLAIRQLQTASVPTFITTAANGGSPFSYDAGVRVQYDAGSGNDIYESLVDANTALPTDATKWAIYTPNVTIPDASETVKGILELATAAEALGGTDTLRAVTSAGLASSKNIAANGYMKLPGGLIFQWGKVTTTAQPQPGIMPFTFPIAYPNACLGIVGSQSNLTSTNNQNVGFSNNTSSLTGATGYIDNNETKPFIYFTFGY